MTASAPSAALGVMSSPTPSTPKPTGPALVVPVDGTLSLGPPKAVGEVPGETNGADTGGFASERRDDAESSAVIQTETGESEVARDDTFGEGDHQIAHGDVDGRLTPVPGRSRSRSISSSSGPSNGDQPSPNSTSISAASQSSQPPRPAAVFNTLPVPPAELGLGTLQGEEQLKSALQSKDRLFLIMVSREIESFVRQVAAGQAPSAAAAIAVGTASTSLLAGHSFRVETSATSKFQRMLVYKAAEWYGLKAVAGTDASIFVGVLGSISDKSAALRLSELVPQPVDAPQTFRIMQRAQPSSSATPTDGSSSRAASVMGDDVALDGPSRAKTFEEREAAYALARERIYGTTNPDGDATQQVVSGGDEETRGRARRQQEDEVDPVPRHSYGVPSLQASMYEPVYPSLYNPPATEGPPHPPIPSQYGQQSLGYGYGNSGMAYPSYPQMGGVTMQTVGGFPGAPPMSSGYGANPQSTSHAQMYGVMPQPYVDGPPGGMAYMQQQTNGYGAHGWQQVPSNGLMTPTMMSMQGQLQQQMPPQQVMGGAQGWPPNAGMSQMMPPQPMPMIPQGMPAYPTAYGYSQPPRQLQNNLYPNLVQPTPVRPQPQHHSSASSSISSRSYQDYSRPHSRGSTTSTRSAASSVRLGVMYPAGQNQGAGYRQKGMKTQGLNGVNGMTGLGIGQERRGRAHSPSSTTTTSSRSSRRAGSINLSQPSPGQHPLPQRPDWAANNIPYQPSPMPLQRGAMISGPSTTDFPPLLRNGTQAEPMQQERAKMRPGTVWNGAAVKALAHGSVVPGPVGTSAPVSPGVPMTSPAPTRTPNPILQPQAGAPSAIVSSVAPSTSGPVSEYDPDFPRRMPGRSTGTLFDPSAPRPISRPESVNRNKVANGLVGSPATSGVSAVPAVVGAGTSGASGSSGSSGLGGLSGLTATTSGMTPEDVIEAKLAAISVSVGVSIGPPAAKSAPAAPGPAPSYAKIVRRD